jgi:hypothetical protein
MEAEVVRPLRTAASKGPPNISNEKKKIFFAQ